MKKSQYLINTRLFNSFILSIFTILFGLWGTGWSIPMVNVSIPGLWYILIIFVLAAQFNFVNLFNDWTGYIISAIVIIFLFYSLLALPKVFSSNDYSRDINYLFQYNFKFISSIGIIFIFYKLCSSFSDFEFQIMLLSIVFFLLYIFLHWKYFYVFNMNYLGVQIGDVASRSGKNSLATAVGVVAPFLFALLFSGKKKWNKFCGFLGLLAAIAFAINIQSRTLTLVLVIGFISMIVFMQNKKLRIKLFGTSLLIIFLLTFSNFDFSSYIYKTGKFSENDTTITDSFEIINYPNADFEIDKDFHQIYFLTHRGWLFTEAWNGSKYSYFLGNGLTTFRIRDTNKGSRTEVHNEWAAVLYEQGIFGFFALLLLLLYRIKRTIKVNLIFTDNIFVTATLTSLIVLSLAMLFINIYSTPVFWVIIAINYLIVEKLYYKSRLNV